MAIYSLDVLNTIRSNASQEYQDRIPVATQENIATIGQAFATYNVLYNEFCSALINKIGKTIIEQKMFKNPLAKFKNGEILDAQDVEEIFIGMAKAEGSYDKDGKNPLGRRTPPPVDVIYHRQNRQDKYVISIGDLDFKRVFKSATSLDTFISGLINSVYSGDAYDEFLAMKNVLATYKNKDKSASGYVTYPVLDLDNSDSSEAFAKNFVKVLRKAVLDITLEPSTKYNVAGVKTKSEVNDLVLFVHKDVVVESDVEMLAKAFHQSNTDMKVVPQIIVVDNFGSLASDNTLGGDGQTQYDASGVYALLVDKDFLRVYDTLSHMEPQRNADGLFTNYFYHHHQILSASTFKNAVALIGVGGK